jgi:hypothetical protein
LAVQNERTRRGGWLLLVGALLVATGAGLTALLKGQVVAVGAIAAGILCFVGGLVETLSGIAGLSHETEAAWDRRLNLEGNRPRIVAILIGLAIVGMTMKSAWQSKRAEEALWGLGVGMAVVAISIWRWRR